MCVCVCVCVCVRACDDDDDDGYVDDVAADDDDCGLVERSIFTYKSFSRGGGGWGVGGRGRWGKS